MEPKPQFKVSFKRLEMPRLEPKNLSIQQVDSLTTTPEKLIAVCPAFYLIQFSVPLKIFSAHMRLLLIRSRNTFNE